MGRPRLYPFSVRKALTMIAVLGGLILTTTATASAMGPWQKSWGDYDAQSQWHDAGWWLQNRHNWVTVNHPEWNENYSETRGQIGDSDRLHVWHYGNGSFDRSAGRSLIVREPDKAQSARGISAKTEASGDNYRQVEGTL
jgi:hypothetical protein